MNRVNLADDKPIWPFFGRLTLTANGSERAEQVWPVATSLHRPRYAASPTGRLTRRRHWAQRMPCSSSGRSLIAW
jgi:hypothetical protein